MINRDKLPSLTLTVIVAVPVLFALGVITSVRFAPVPLNWKPVIGTSVLFDDVAERVKFAVGVSRSPMRKEIGLVVVFFGIV